MGCRPGVQHGVPSATDTLLVTDFRSFPKVALGGWASPSPTNTRSGANIGNVLQCFLEKGGSLSTGKLDGRFQRKHLLSSLRKRWEVWEV